MLFCVYSSVSMFCPGTAGTGCACVFVCIPVLVLECLFSISSLLVLLDIVRFVGRGEGRAGVNCFLLYQNLRGLPGRGWKFGTAWGKNWTGRCRGQYPCQESGIVMSSHTSRPCFSQGNKACHLSEQKGLAVIFRTEPQVPGPGSSRACALTVPLLSPGSRAQQCYSFQHIYFGPFDLSNVNFSNVFCPQGCSEAVLSLNTGEGQETQDKKGKGDRARGRG